METSKLVKGKHLEMVGKILSVFGHKGYVSKEKWVVNFLCDAYVKISPFPSSPEIEDIINIDIAGGNSKKIKHIKINPKVALFLYLEGKLTRQDIENAETKRGN